MEHDSGVSSDRTATVDGGSTPVDEKPVDGWERTQSEDVATAVVEAVATEKGQDELDLEPLGDVVDPDALGQVFAGRDGVTGHIAFEYEGCLIQLDSDGRVTAIEQ